MSKYTIKLGEILTNIMIKDEQSDIYHVKPYSYDTDPYIVVEKTRTKFFDFLYELYNPTVNKERLEKKLLTHYYNYEICVDMPMHFKFLFKNTLNEILPYYNKLYKVMEEEFDPLLSVDYKENTEGDGSNIAMNKSKSELDSTTKDKYEDDNDDKNKTSDTPQGELDDIYDDRYVSNLQNNVGHSEGKKTNTIDSETNLEQTNNGSYKNSTERIIKGNDGISKSELLIKYTKAIQNVDMQIIKDKEIQSLFMQVW